MKKNLKFYALIWGLLLVLWFAAVLLVRSIIPGYVIIYDARFWIAFVLITAAFIGNLLCARAAFKAENLQKMFLNLPLITINRSALIAMLLAGSILMLIPGCPAWVAAIVCLVILVFNGIAVTKAVWAADAVEMVEEKVIGKTSFIRNMTVEAERLMTRAKSPDVKAACKKVYEAIRYSDPMSNERLSEIERKIAGDMEKLSAAVVNEDEIIGDIVDEVVTLVNDRNKKCKMLK